MKQHFIHYLPRRVVAKLPTQPSAPWFAEARALATGFARPTYHVTRSQHGPTASVRPGDVIWIVSQLASPWGTLPPAIDARINVGRVEISADGRRRFTAARSSAWFPLYDATRLIAELETIDASDKRTRLRPDPAIPIGQVLQSMRKLADATPLIRNLEKLATNPLNFISYRISDGTFDAFRKAAQLMRQGQSVYWDRWCLPRRLAERRELVSIPALNRHLMTKLKNSQIVWGIESPLYAEPTSYSAKERTRAIALGTYKRVAAKAAGID